MKISLEQNVKHDQGDVPYYVNVETSTITIDLDTIFHIPVYRSGNGRPGYNVEVCGFQVSADAPEQIVPVTERLIRGLVNMARLPTYIFIARRSRQMYPVYTVGDEVFATTPGGPVFRHVELAKVREYLAEYLNAMGLIGTPGMSEKLRVRGVNMNSLALVRPILYLKKRPQSEDENEFWAPVFLADDRGSIYTYAASGKREIDLAGGYEALLLRTQVAQALIADKRLKNNYDLRPDRLLPDYWERVKSTLKLQPEKLVFAGAAFEIYRNGKAVIAAEHREDEDRYSLYIGRDINDLRHHAATDLVRRGLISNTAAVNVQ
ncbi:MAG: hypothetical protein JW953_23450 [Anaerolineae bacterium]|nr:hypothetical protein [Anaerolineae bacterium]